MVTSCSQPLEEAHKLRGVLDWANSANDQTAPEVISNLSGTSIASNSLTLQWSAATDDVGVLEYLIFQDGSVVDSTSSLHLDISGLAASTTYEFYVVTKDVAGNLSGNSNSASLTTLAQGEEDTTAPSAPSNLVVVATTATTVSLQWDASTDNVGVNDYLILQDGVPEDSTGNTAITISDLSANSEYVFQIIARDVSGNSSSGSEITATTSEEEDFTPPSAPANLMLLETTSSTVSFQWDASTDDVGVNDYLIYQDGVLIDSTSDTEMTIEGLMSNTSYNFYVEARDESGNRSESSEVLSITTEQEFVEDITAPSTPGNLRISNSSTSSITLEWDESFDDIGVNRYVVFQDNDPSDSTGQTTITIEDLPAGRNLSFHVVAKDAAGNTSSSSNTVLLSTITLGATFTNDDLVVYPNPVINGNLHLALRDKAMSELKVIDMAGKIVDHRMLSNQQAHDVTIRLNVKPGLYTVIVRTDAGRRVSKRIRIVN
ncbi:MAG TPA: hypothetical protein DHN29_12740 [Cytophagales bacterium]|nr:hypothetical protein [Cytophagales bacterium]